jgi:hypothetical protein
MTTAQPARAANELHFVVQCQTCNGDIVFRQAAAVARYSSDDATRVRGVELECLRPLCKAKHTYHVGEFVACEID